MTDLELIHRVIAHGELDDETRVKLFAIETHLCSKIPMSGKPKGLPKHRRVWLEALLAYLEGRPKPERASVRIGELPRFPPGMREGTPRHGNGRMR